METPPPPPLPPTAFHKGSVKAASDGRSLRGTHQYVKEALKLEEEVSYLVGPLLHQKSASSGADSHCGDSAKTVIVFVRDIRPVLQNGPMCGLVAITMASEILQRVPRSGLDCDLESACFPDSLLRFARGKGFTKQGEMFSVEYMLEVTQEATSGLCRGEVVPSAFLSDVGVLVSSITAGKAILVPYDADKDHTPCLAQGHKAHWCTITGFAMTLDSSAVMAPQLLECCNPQKPGTLHYTLKDTTIKRFASLLASSKHEQSESLFKTMRVFTRHGKSRHMGLWSLKELVESNQNLVEVSPQRDGCEEYVIPMGGIVEGLCSKTLVLSS